MLNGEELLSEDIVGIPSSLNAFGVVLMVKGDKMCRVEGASILKIYICVRWERFPDVGPKSLSKDVVVWALIGFLRAYRTTRRLR